MKPTGPTTLELQKLIQELKEASIKHKAGIWKTVARELEKPTRRRRVVNVYKLNLVTKPNETVVIPGKLLGTGEVTHPVKVAAYQFSSSARERVKAMSIQELIKENPKGKDVRIIG